MLPSLVPKLEKPLTKSYISTCDDARPLNTGMVMSQIIGKTRKEGHDSVLVNLDTGSRVSSLEILQKVTLTFGQRF